MWRFDMLCTIKKMNGSISWTWTFMNETKNAWHLNNFPNKFKFILKYKAEWMNQPKFGKPITSALGAEQNILPSIPRRIFRSHVSVVNPIIRSVNMFATKQLIYHFARYVKKLSKKKGKIWWIRRLKFFVWFSGKEGIPLKMIHHDIMKTIFERANNTHKKSCFNHFEIE